MHDIFKDGKVLARLITADDIGNGLTFFSKADEYIQVGSWNYSAGVELKRHIHNEVTRSVKRTQEVLVVLRGLIEATIYDLEEHFIETVSVGSGDILILFDSGHGYHILENDTIVIEIKNGPYLGADIDRRRF